MSKGFERFTKQNITGSKKKELIRQEKKKVRKETQEFFAKKKAERYASKYGQDGADKEQGSGPRKQGSKFREQGAGNKFQKKEEQGSGNKPQRSGYKGQRSENKTERFRKQDSGFKPQGRNSRGDQKTDDRGRGQERGFKGKDSRQKGQDARFKPQGTGFKGQTSEGGSRHTKPAIVKKSTPVVPIQKAGKFDKTAKSQQAPEKEENTKGKGGASGVMPLNKFIAYAGVCSRRDAADIVKDGKVVVNGTRITEPGFKVSQQDEIKVNGKKIVVRKNLVYILLNKPKDYITTTDDPEGRRTVLDIIKNATTERVYPIGRLDRNTTGVLLLTNDGELTQKLSHPSYQVKKIYEVRLDKPLTKKDFEAILAGITLEDGFIAPDVLAYADSKDKSIIGIEIHSGRNRIVRRIFEHLGYDVRNLDRVMYANLTKKNVERGKWRFLSDKEVRLLKFLNASYTKK
ncbi:MAG: pseudouridine synthase [Chitinophagaceae bacterium]